MRAELPRETETKLVIRSAEPVRYARRIWSLRNVSVFRLDPRRTLDLRDTYFDTPDRRLSKAGHSLRVRRGDRTLLLAIKGPSNWVVAGAPQRTEVEMRWSPNTLPHLRAVLQSAGISLKRPGAFSGRPERVLRDMGLIVLLDRATRRIQRVVKRKPSNDMRALLTIDRVTDTVDSSRVHHYEIEIEAKGSDFSSVTDLTEDLRKAIGPALAASSHSKLAIGLALRELAERGKLPRYLAPSGYLLPDGWDAIDRILVDPGVTAEPRGAGSR
jgi:inorganic triphosphatase YgiF